MSGTRDSEAVRAGPPLADRLIVALDFDDVARAQACVAQIGDAVGFYKVGLELAYAPGGLDFARSLVDAGAKLFIDLKLHDIPTTVERAARQLARLGATFLTVHAYPQTMAAARDGVGGTPTRLLGVTVMTSYDDADLAEAGYAGSVAETVARRARQARAAGVDGLILSPHEVGATRASLGRQIVLVTPGVRPDGAGKADQKRVMTPGEAIAAGADHLVIGRPVTQAPDPRAAALAIHGEMQRQISRER